METSASFEARSAPSSNPIISLSGSGEGLGDQSPRGYSTILDSPRMLSAVGIRGASRNRR